MQPETDLSAAVATVEDLPVNSLSTSPPAEPVGVAPVAQQERIAAVDVVRGCAVLGILLMNILTFALVFGGGNDPTNTTLNGGNTRANLAYWFVSQVFFEGKMRALFSMLFGAGVVLLVTRGDERGGGLRVADIFYRRTMWLILFGILHAYFIWWGDILYPYGVFGLFLFPLRKANPKWLLVAGIVLLLIGSGRFFWMGYDDYKIRARAQAAERAAATGQQLTDEQKADQKKWEEKQKEFTLDKEKTDKDLAAHRGSYGKLFAYRAPQVAQMQSGFMYRFAIHDIAAMMLIGMALLLMGVLTGQRSNGFYLKLMLFGYLVGGGLNAIVGWYLVKTHFYPVGGMMLFMGSYDSGRLLVALGHIGLIMLIVKHGSLQWLTSRLAAVGQTALSGYLATSVICSTLFYGYGFALFGKLQRYQLLYVVLAVWVFLLVVSPIWLRLFRYGPMEWVWRSLTYWQKQPMKLRQAEPLPQMEPSTT
ncbi:MAG: DUF418 domain-containing protein [Blastocatellia bacterium]